jgi:hypothetical protein
MAGEQADMSGPEGALPVGLPAGVTVISIHPIYSPGRITLATLIGGPLGGSWLMALNYKRFAEPRNARMAIALGALGTAAAIALWLTIGGGAALWLWIAPVIAVGMLAPLLQGIAYDRHIAVGGRRGSSWRAAGVGAVSLAVYLAVILGSMAIQFVATMPNKVMFGGKNVFYADGASRVEAEMVGKELAAREPNPDTSRWAVEVRRDGKRPVIAFIVPVGHMKLSDKQAQSNFHEVAEPLSRAVYGGAPVDIWLIDGFFRPHVKLSWESRPR